MRWRLSMMEARCNERSRFVSAWPGIEIRNVRLKIGHCLLFCHARAPGLSTRGTIIVPGDRHYRRPPIYDQHAEIITLGERTPFGSS